jgi:hypothetical protein
MGVGGKRHARAALPRERPYTLCIGGSVGPRAGLDGREKSRKNRDSIQGPSSLYRVAIPTELSRPSKRHKYAMYCDLRLNQTAPTSKNQILNENLLIQLYGGSLY